MCESNECGEYPYYGVAPHECYWRKPGGFGANPLGTSTIKLPANWAGNFLAEIEYAKPVGKQLSYGLCGVYYCPQCKLGMVETDQLWTAQKIARELSREAA